ncbi:MAG: cell division protein FtsB [Verrucomicrobiales bacterium]|jgi:cell division protein FtsB
MASPEKETIWQTLSRITVTLIIVAALGVALTFFIPELDHQKALDRDIVRLEAERQEALATRDDLKRELRLLNDDPEYLEIKARDRLNMYKEGETILQIEGNELEPVNGLTTGVQSSGQLPTG